MQYQNLFANANGIIFGGAVIRSDSWLLNSRCIRQGATGLESILWTQNSFRDFTTVALKI